LYVAFVIDVYTLRIVGWRVSSSMHTEFVLGTLEQALYARQSECDGELIHHSDRGSQKLRQTITGNLRVSPPWWWPDLYQPASTKAGAVHPSCDC
jgi:transposase InsO family protein